MKHERSFDPYAEAIDGPTPDPWRHVRDVDRVNLFEDTPQIPDASPSLPTPDLRRLDIAAKALQESRQAVDGRIVIEPVMKRDRDALRRPLPPEHI